MSAPQPWWALSSEKPHGFVGGKNARVSSMHLRSQKPQVRCRIYNHLYHCLIIKLSIQLHIPTEIALVAAPPTMFSEASSSYNYAQKGVATGLSAYTLRKYSTTWKKWEALCTWTCIPADIARVKEPVTFLQISAERIRTGVLFLP